MRTNAEEEQLTVRPVRVADAAAVARLSAQLGYVATAHAVQDRIQALLRLSSDRIGLVAERGDEVLGWIDAAIERHLQVEDAIVIGGLVVDETARGRGVGKILCEAVERWAHQRGYMRIRVRSQIRRTDAHRFYLRDGYRQVKTSLVFEKNLE